MKDPTIEEHTVEEVEMRRIHVKVPSDPVIKNIIDKLAIYVSEDGHFFEKELLAREIKGIPALSFLKQKCSDEAHYYRWKVFSLLADLNKFPEKKMFRGGAEWIPINGPNKK